MALIALGGDRSLADLKESDSFVQTPFYTAKRCIHHLFFSLRIAAPVITAVHKSSMQQHSFYCM